MMMEMMVSMEMIMDSGDGDDDASCLGFIAADNVVAVMVEMRVMVEMLMRMGMAMDRGDGDDDDSCFYRR